MFKTVCKEDTLAWFALIANYGEVLARSGWGAPKMRIARLIKSGCKRKFDRWKKHWFIAQWGGENWGSGEKAEAEGRVSGFLKICFVGMVGAMEFLSTNLKTKEKQSILRKINNDGIQQHFHVVMSQAACQSQQPLYLSQPLAGR